MRPGTDWATNRYRWLPRGLGTTVLGPILFILYINDLQKFSDLVQSTLFADDTTITQTDSNFYILTDTATVELRELVEWTYANKLLLNVDKTC